MTISSERWGPLGAKAAETSGEEAALAARVSSVRALWSTRPRAPSPPPPTRKMRSRRRQPRRITHLPPPLTYCLEAPLPLVCDPGCKFQFDAPPRPTQLSECQRAIGRLSASVQAVMRASAARYPPYRGTNVSRYAPTSQRPDRRYLWWPRDHPSPRLENKFRLAHLQPKETPQVKPQPVLREDAEVHEKVEAKAAEKSEQETEPAEIPKSLSQETVADGPVPTTSAAADTGLSKKRLYSTVLSMSAPAPVNISQVSCVRLSQKLVTPGLLKLNPKIVHPSARIRPPNVDNKFEELEKEALEQYKASDESIDTKFKELEKEAVEQYSNSNSNTSCGSGNSAQKRVTSSPSAPDVEPCPKKSPPAKYPKEKSDSVVVYSQNFEAPAKAQPTSGTNLKNFHTPPRGEKKEQLHRPCKSARCFKGDSQRAASDTDNDARESSCKGHKGSRWTLHVGPKKRHLSLCVSDFSSDEELDDASAIKDAGPRMKNHAVGKAKMSAHGGGDLQPILRKT